MGSASMSCRKLLWIRISRVGMNGPGWALFSVYLDQVVDHRSLFDHDRTRDQDMPSPCNWSTVSWVKSLDEVGIEE